ncbi:MAG: tRNA (adenosine(37)-N6)-dimethylallyltransferase MiaA [Clostridia bacterium]|nr:tRNA (adenosine(37)-N6)-dimethylallyltransferase MiaA [Clostridia bacterium]
MGGAVVITGPTASGKTDIAVELALLIGGEVVGADAIQIFRHCDIGSAKPSDSEKRGIPHHMMDILEPHENFSVATYKDMAGKIIDDIISRGKIPVITGGTGLYIEALIKNIDFADAAGRGDADEKYIRILDEKGREYLFEMLRQRDPGSCEKLHPNNVSRVIRYLEILDGFKGTLGEYMKRAVECRPAYDYMVFVIYPKREHLYERIKRRTEGMLEAGLIAETEGILALGTGRGAQSMQGIGYRETIQYLEGLLNYEEYRRLLERNTRRYAKRQYTWSKRYGDVQFLDPGQYETPAKTAQKIADIMKKAEFI